MGSSKYLISFQHEVNNYCMNELTIDEEPSATYICKYSEMGMPVRDLGLFYISLEDNNAELKNILDIVTSNKIAEKPVRIDQQRVGALYKKFYIQFNGQESFNAVDTSTSLPELLRDLEKGLNKLLSLVRRSPIRAMFIDVNVAPGRLVIGDEFVVNMSFYNNGSQAAKFGNPAFFRKKTGDTIRLNFYIKKADEAGNKIMVYSHSIDLAEREFIIEARKTLPRDKKYISLIAKGSISAKVGIRLPKCDPNNYDVELIYIHIDDENEDEDLVFGEYHSDSIPIIVKS